MKARYVGILHNSNESLIPNAFKMTTDSQARSHIVYASRRKNGQESRGQGLGGREETTWKPPEGERRLRGEGTKVVRLMAMSPKLGKENRGLAFGLLSEASCLTPTGLPL